MAPALFLCFLEALKDRGGCAGTILTMRGVEGLLDEFETWLLREGRLKIDHGIPEEELECAKICLVDLLHEMRIAARTGKDMIPVLDHVFERVALDVSAMLNAEDLPFEVRWTNKIDRELNPLGEVGRFVIKKMENAS